MPQISAPLRVLQPYDPVHLISHKETRTYFGIHKTHMQRSMTYVPAFVSETNANTIAAKMNAYKRTTGVWPNRILPGNSTAYFGELHDSDDEDESGEVEVVATTIGKLRKILHFRNIAVEILYDITLRPDFKAVAVDMTPRNDEGSYVRFLNRTLSLPTRPYRYEGELCDLYAGDEEGNDADVWFADD